MVPDVSICQASSRFLEELAACPRSAFGLQVSWETTRAGFALCLGPRV